MEELILEYEQLFEKEKRIDAELQLLLNNQHLNQSKFNSLTLLVPKVQLIYNDSENLSNMISFTTSLADNVSSKVRVLDLAKGRVTNCMKRVTDILDLKACTDGVTEALEEEDYETAANHIHRYLSFDKDSLRLKTSPSFLDKSLIKEDLINLNAESFYLDHSFNLLQESKLKLQKIVDDKYNQALKQNDFPQLERFFKIFPLIDLSQSGLLKFSSYLCLQITQTADENFNQILIADKSEARWNVIFADALILLFEKVARVIEGYQPVIEKYYGHGNMIEFIKNIQKECDFQACKIMNKFKEIRSMNSIFNRIQNFQKILTTNLNGSTGINNNFEKDEKIDPRDLDELLTEITLISSRSELYKNFLLKSISNDLNGAEKKSQYLDKNLKLEEAEKFIKNCDLSFSMQELIGKYSILENYFMTENIQKAIQLDTILMNSFTSSVVDDVFFIIKKCIKRCLYSDSVDGCCAMFNNCSSVLETTYKDFFYSQLKVGFINTFTDLAQAYTAIQRRFQSSDSQTDKEKIKFLVTLNNLEESIEFISTIRKSFEEDISKLFVKESKSSKEKLNSCLNDLDAVGDRFKELINFGLEQLNTSDIKPRIKQLFDTYQTINHKIVEDEYGQYSNANPFMQNLIKNIDQMHSLYKDNLSSRNRDLLIGILVSEITAGFEKNIYKCSYSKYGGLQLDKDIRVLINFLTTLNAWSVREKFSRLIQISIILSLDGLSELFEYWNSPLTITWRLTPNEIRQILMLRFDFKINEIKSLNL